jgi:hypothetical protein
MISAPRCRERCPMRKTGASCRNIAHIEIRVTRTKPMRVQLLAQSRKTAQLMRGVTVSPFTAATRVRTPLGTPSGTARRVGLAWPR